MIEPAKPNNELNRLEALRCLNILDTDSDERFDRLTRMARRLFDVEIALVSLIDENRQWFKSSSGLDASETGRDISFCGHAILGGDTFYIQDASKDSRFSDNPLVTGPPNIRFYAGRPICAPNGEKLGTLCIIDSQPKSMSQEDFDALDDLASMVEKEIEALSLATIDELTSLANLRGFTSLAKHAISVSNRRNSPLTIAYFDLDNFKPINDEHGHAEGDRALRVFAQQIATTFRTSDLFARLGGDEFVVLFADADEEKADKLIKRFSAELKQQVSSLELEYRILFSHGIVNYNQQKHASIEELIKAADQVMYAEKKKISKSQP